MRKADILKKTCMAFAVAFMLVGLTSTKTEAKTRNIKVTAPSGKTVKVAKGKNVKLKTIIKGLKNKGVKYKSNNPAVVKVTANGIVKGLRTGKTKIVVTSKTNKKVKKSVNVVVYKNSVRKIKLNVNNRTLSINQTFKLKATVVPKKNVCKILKFSSSNKKVAKVTKKGLVKAVGVGTTKIVVRATDGSNKKAVCTVNVTDSNININEELGIKSVSIRGYKSLDLELTAPKKLEMEDIKISTKYLSDSKLWESNGVIDLHTKDNVHYEVVIYNALEYSRYVKVEINTLPGVKVKEFIVDKGAVYSESNNGQTRIVDGDTIERYIVKNVGEYVSLYPMSSHSECLQYTFPIKTTVSNLPEGISSSNEKDGTCMHIYGKCTKVLNGYKSTVTGIDAKGKKFYINYYFYIGDEDNIVAAAYPSTFVAYNPNRKGIKFDTISGKNHYEPNVETSGKMYYRCENYKATGCPENINISSTGYLYVEDYKKSVKPGTYNIVIFAESSGKLFSFTYTVTFVEGAVVSGKAIDSKGNPIVNERIYFESELNKYCRSTYEDIYTNSKGEYELVIVPGKYNIISDFYFSQKNEITKNTVYDFKSNYYKLHFTSPLLKSLIGDYTYEYFIIRNTALYNTIYTSSQNIYNSDYSIDKDVYCFVRKGATYRFNAYHDYNFIIDGVYYKVKEVEFTPTGQDSINVEFEVYDY